MKRSAVLLSGIIVSVVVLGQLGGAQAAITWTGDIDPTDPTGWTTSTTGYVGKTADGTVSVNGGSDLYSKHGYVADGSGAVGQVTVSGAGSTWSNSGLLYVGNSGSGTLAISGGGRVSNVYDGCLGYNAGSTGTATVSGTGSNWINSKSFYVGKAGDGALTIANGGSVSVAQATYVGYGTGTTGVIDFGAGGGTLTTQSLCASPSQLIGTGTIDTRGLVSDVDLVFDASHGLNQTFTLNSGPGQEIALELDMSGSVGDLGAGYAGDGSLTIRDGSSVTSRFGYVGFKSGSTGTATVDGPGSTWTASYELVVGNSGSGTLVITGGAAVTNTGIGYIGHKAGSTGTVTIIGAESSWTTNRGLYIGSSGNGTLNINGGTVSSGSCGIGMSYGSTGTATVDGAGSIWNCGRLDVGSSGGGALTISGGGTVNNNDASLGSSGGSTGEVTVSGAGSTWINSRSLYVGKDGNGTLAISDGGSVVVASTTYVGSGTGSTSMIDFGAGGGILTTQSLCAAPSRLTGTGKINARGLVSDVALAFDASHGLTQAFTLNSEPGQNVTVQLDMSDPNDVGDLGAGYEANGSLAIRDGRAIASRSGVVGFKPGSTGTATVEGSGSTWTNSGALYIGGSGDGTLRVSGGAVVVNSDLASVGSGVGSTGAVTVAGAGSIWTNAGTLYVGASGNGTMNVSGGGAVSSKYGYLGFHGGSAGEVTVEGAGSTWTNSHSLRVGSKGPGTLAVSEGGLVSVGEALIIGISIDDDSSVNMSTGGMLALWGDADDSLAEFLGLISGTDTIQYWSFVVDDWASITEATPGTDYTLAYIDDTGSNLFGYTLLTVGTIPEVPGDVNCDGRVDDADVTIMAAHWGEAGDWTRGDFNHDGFINVRDAAILAANWGASTGEARGVPEPGSTALLVGLGGLVFLRGRRVETARWG